jgi:Protein of unknown function (DUF1653)
MLAIRIEENETMDEKDGLDGKAAMNTDAFVRPGDIWVHERTRGRYSVVCVALEEATETEVIVYRSLSNGVAWTRPLEQFIDGRFTRLLVPDEKAQRKEHLRIAVQECGYTPEAVAERLCVDVAEVITACETSVGT